MRTRNSLRPCRKNMAANVVGECACGAPLMCDTAPGEIASSFGSCAPCELARHRSRMLERESEALGPHLGALPDDLLLFCAYCTCVGPVGHQQAGRLAATCRALARLVRTRLLRELCIVVHPELCLSLQRDARLWELSHGRSLPHWFVPGTGASSLCEPSLVAAADGSSGCDGPSHVDWRRFHRSLSLPLRWRTRAWRYWRSRAGSSQPQPKLRLHTGVSAPATSAASIAPSFARWAPAQMLLRTEQRLRAKAARSRLGLFTQLADAVAASVPRPFPLLWAMACEASSSHLLLAGVMSASLLFGVSGSHCDISDKFEVAVLDDGTQACVYCAAEQSPHRTRSHAHYATTASRVALSDVPFLRDASDLFRSRVRVDAHTGYLERALLCPHGHVVLSYEIVPRSSAADSEAYASESSTVDSLNGSETDGEDSDGWASHLSDETYGSGSPLSGSSAYGDDDSLADDGEYIHGWWTGSEEDESEGEEDESEGEEEEAAEDCSSGTSSGRGGTSDSDEVQELADVMRGAARLWGSSSSLVAGAAGQSSSAGDASGQSPAASDGEDWEGWVDAGGEGDGLGNSERRGVVTRNGQRRRQQPDQAANGVSYNY